jgi:multisubunit Na+/H+ antiporter MnhF subunit
MIIYNPLTNIKFPLNVMMLYGILLPISSLDVIAPEISTDLIFTMSSEETPYSDTLENMGYETHNFIYNLGTMFWIISFLTMGLLLVLISFIIKNTLRKFKG